MLVLDAADMVNYYLEAFSEPNTLRYITSAIGYTLRPATLVLIISVLLRNKKRGFIIWIPILVLAVLSFTSQYTHLIFWFDVHNNFMRGTLSLLPYIISGLYMLLMVILTIKTHYYISIGEIIVVLYIVLLCSVSVILESLGNTRFLLTGSMLISCTLYYTLLCVQNYKRDTLTGLLNRHSFYNDSHSFAKDAAAVISIDMNGFKQINDTMGHHAGDRALAEMAKCLKLKCNRDVRPYRIGGDEFVILMRNRSDASVEALIGEIRALLAKSALSASFGYALYRPGDDFDAVCNQADENMYRKNPNISASLLSMPRSRKNEFALDKVFDKTRSVWYNSLVASSAC